jgi:hypothetical protein
VEAGAMMNLVIEHCYTRDARIPLSDNDPNFDCGWQCIPVPPTIDEGWIIFDRSKDRRTGWRRIRIVEITP